MNAKWNSDDSGDGLSHRPPQRIDAAGLRHALVQLSLFDDPYLRMQALNLAVVDQFITGLEAALLTKLHEQESTPSPEAGFVLAISQMWIFAAYELLRTWRQRARNIVKWSDNGGLATKLRELEADVGLPHTGRSVRAEQIRQVISDPSIVIELRDQLRLTHILFSRVEALRVAIAKHEVRGKRNSVALAPGYGRIDERSGSLKFELENGIYSMGYISRRALADEIRSLTAESEPPTDEMIREFDEYMHGPVDIE